MSKTNEFYCDCTVVHGDAVSEVKAHMPEGEMLFRAANLYKIFADQTRIRILWALNVREMCVCDIANLLSMTKSAISHQLFTLRESGLVKFRRDGKTVFYSLSDEHVSEILNLAVEHLSE